MGFVRDRLFQAIITYYLIVSLTFLLVKLRSGFGSPPTPEGYVAYILRVFGQGDLGVSGTQGGPVLQIIFEKAPWTIFLAAIGLVFGLLIAVLLGSFMAYYEGTTIDVGLTVTMVLNNAIPAYIAAIFLLMYLGFKWRIFPDGGRFDPDATPGINWPFIASVFYYGALPSLSVLITGFGRKALELRANAIRLVGSEYLYVARLRGLSDYRIATMYLSRNAIIPLYTQIVIGLGALLGGSVVIEQIFQYPGMGLLLLEAAEGRDFSLLMGVFIVTAGVFIVGTLVADFTYAVIDPRADVTARRGAQR